MTFFTRNGDMFAPTSSRESLLDTLPVGNYIVVETMQGLMFKQVPSFGDPGRIYGNLPQRADRIMTTFQDRPRTTGVLLEGEKGGGKSQLARMISRLGYERDMPTIIINAPWCGDAFNALLATVEQPAIILMDEFEKVYEQRGAQEQVLTLLDGLMTSKKLFVLTVNNKYGVNEHMKNRPGRIFYSLSFSGLEAEFIQEYCTENLNDTDQIDNVLRIASMFSAFNFDMLKALVEEMNRYKEDAFEAITLLNAKPMETDIGVTYEVVVTKGDYTSEIAEVNELPMAARNNTLALWAKFPQVLEVEPDAQKKVCNDLGLSYDDVKNGDATRSFVIEGRELKNIDAENGRYKFVTDGFTIEFTKKKAKSYDLRDWAGAY